MDRNRRQGNLTLFLLMVCLFGWLWGGGPATRTPYFFGAGPFCGLAGLGFLLFFAGRALRRHGAAAAAWITATVFLAYATMEMFFQHVPLRVPVMSDAPAAVAFFGIVNEYILDRSYQYVAILVLWLLLRQFLADTPVPTDDSRPAHDQPDAATAGMSPVTRAEAIPSPAQGNPREGPEATAHDLTAPDPGSASTTSLPPGPEPQGGNSHPQGPTSATVPDIRTGHPPASDPAGWTTFLRCGDPSRETTILGGSLPMTWTRVATRIGVMLVLLGGAHAWLRMDRPVDGVLLATLGGRWLGGFNNSLIEELVFRALLLPALATALRPGAANLFQAAFFAVIHYTCIPEWELAAVATEAGRLLLYLGIGWLLGRSAWETRGIAVSTVLHFLVTGILWTTLVLMGK